MAHKVYLFVCCHGARDARCGERGPALLAALRDAFARRGAGAHVAVAATSHIGGHEFAGNAVCYGPAHPCDGDWFGGLDAARAIRLGADLVSMAGAVLQAALEGPDALEQHLGIVLAQLRTACFCTGSADLAQLRQARLLPAGTEPYS